MTAERTQPNLWQATAPAAPATGPLSGERTVDVAIIGGRLYRPVGGAASR